LITKKSPFIYEKDEVIINEILKDKNFLFLDAVGGESFSHLFSKIQNSHAIIYGILSL